MRLLQELHKRTKENASTVSKLGKPRFTKILVKLSRRLYPKKQFNASVIARPHLIESTDVITFP